MLDWGLVGSWGREGVWCSAVQRGAVRCGEEGRREGLLELFAICYCIYRHLDVFPRPPIP